MNAVPDKSIATRIAVLLGLFCLVLCAFLISLLQLLRMLSQEADETVNVALPNMALASYMSKESEWLKGILYDGILSRDRFVHLGVMQEIAARRFPAQMLERIDGLSVEPGIKEKLRNNIRELDGVLRRADKAVSRRIETEAAAGRIVKRIRALGESLPVAEGNEAVEEWKAARTDVFTAMLLLSTHPDRPYALRLRHEIRGGVRRLLDAAERGGPHSDGLRAASAHVAAMALNRRDGLLALDETYTTLENEIDELRLTHQYTSDSLIETTNALFQRSWDSIQASRKTLTERYALIVATVGATFMLAIVLACFIYRSIVRHVVDPIKKLNRCMLDRVRRIPTPFPDSVRYELAEMTASVRYFTTELEKHEKELLHSHEHLEREVADRTRELKALSEKLLMAQENERFKLASELHDNIGATLGAIKFGIERSLRGLPPGQADIRDTLSTSVGLVKKLAVHLRRIQNELRPPQLELGLEATIADFCEEYQRVFPLSIDLSIALGEAALPPNLPIVIFRIIQEALSNIVKHSGATRAQVTLRMDGEALELSVRDDGKGFSVAEKLADVSVKSGLGLKSLRERAQLSSGLLTIESEPGRGTGITVVWNESALRG